MQTPVKTTSLNDFSEFERRLSVIKVAENMHNIPLSDMMDDTKMNAMIFENAKKIRYDWMTPLQKQK